MGAGVPICGICFEQHQAYTRGMGQTVANGASMAQTTAHHAQILGTMLGAVGASSLQGALTLGQGLQTGIRTAWTAATAARVEDPDRVMTRSLEGPLTTGSRETHSADPRGRGLGEVTRGRLGPGDPDPEGPGRGQIGVTVYMRRVKSR